MRLLSIFLTICYTVYINGLKQEIHCSYTYEIAETAEEVSKSVTIQPKSADDCKNRLTEDNKKDGDKCCYSYYSKKDDENRCTTIDKYEYENFGKYMKRIKLQEEIYKDNPDQKKLKEEYGIKIILSIQRYDI